MNVINFEQFKNTEDYSKFISSNQGLGSLKVQVFTAYGAFPISDTEVVITKDFGDNRVVFFRGKTDSSGIIDNIDLPAPLGVDGSIEAPLYTLYDLTAVHIGYESFKQYSIGMFGGIKVIQYIKMMPEIILEGVVQDGN